MVLSHVCTIQIPMGEEGEASRGRTKIETIVCNISRSLPSAAGQGRRKTHRLRLLRSAAFFSFPLTLAYGEPQKNPKNLIAFFPKLHTRKNLLNTMHRIFFGYPRENKTQPSLLLLSVCSFSSVRATANWNLLPRTSRSDGAQAQQTKPHWQNEKKKK